ncbi:MAG: hypothetical protein RLZ98_3071 [Pseudomonadota bacterium]|jgi:periplasmic divalent cation tolerance protein
MNTGDQLVLVYSTYPSEAAAQDTARELLASRLAACVNLLPGMTSFYEWQGAFQQASEVVLLAKTRAGLAEAAMALVARSHPYDTPAILVLPAMTSAPGFTDWVLTQTTASDKATGES